MLITKSEAARRLNITRQAVEKLEKKEPRPEYFIESSGKVFVNSSHEDWLQKLKQSESKGIKQHITNEKVSHAKQIRADIKKSVFLNSDNDDDDIKPGRGKVPEIPDAVKSPELEELQRQAAIAAMQDIIFGAGIKREKEMQERLKTAEIKKDLANIDLLIHFFSFIENIIQRWYRRPHEIGPKLSELYLGGQDREAEQLLLREMESIVKETQKELLSALDEEGIKFKGVLNK